MREHAAEEHSADESMNLLATINRQIAEGEPTVSPYCRVTYIGSETEWIPRIHVFAQEGEAVPFSFPMVISGIDPSYWVEEMVRTFNAGEKPNLDPKKIQRNTDRRP